MEKNEGEMETLKKNRTFITNKNALKEKPKGNTLGRKKLNTDGNMEIQSNRKGKRMGKSKLRWTL